MYCDPVVASDYVRLCLPDLLANKILLCYPLHTKPQHADLKKKNYVSVIYFETGL